MKNTLSTILISYLFIAMADAQIIRGVIISEKDRTPIADAFIFISNTNYAVASDKDGYFEIEAHGFAYVSLTITQINYEILIVDVDPLNKDVVQIKLIPRDNRIDEVRLTKTYDPKIRERRIKRFTSAILGLGHKKKKVAIKNRKQLLLYEEDDILKVVTDQPVVIENYELGYRIKFFIKYFQLDRFDQVILIGSAYIEELAIEVNRKKKIVRNRRKVYSKSKKKFLYSLYHNVDMNDYNLAFRYGTKVDYDFRSIDYKALKADFLSVGEHIEIKRIELPRELRVQEKAKGLYSYLKSTTGELLIDSYGNILNIEAVHESGTWSSKRLSSLLPYDYLPKG